MGEAVRRFPLDDSALHLCIDMQRLFAESTPWHVPWLGKVLPAVVEISRSHAERTVFTRFRPPNDSQDAIGAWRDFYDHWKDLTRQRIDPRLLELVEPLAALTPPARVVDKPANSAFSRLGFARALRSRGIQTLIVTGGETDVCITATVMAAIDLGFRIVLPTDALCSSRDATHDALLTLYRERFSLQIETTTTEDILQRWSPSR